MKSNFSFVIHLISIKYSLSTYSNLGRITTFFPFLIFVISALSALILKLLLIFLLQSGNITRHKGRGVLNPLGTVVPKIGT